MDTTASSPSPIEIACSSGRVVIGAVDYLDRLKGVASKLLAWETLLTDYKAYRTGHVLVQVCVGARNRIQIQTAPQVELACMEHWRSPYHPIALSPYHPITLSPYRPIALSPSITLSPYHPITLSPPPSLPPPSMRSRPPPSPTPTLRRCVGEGKSRKKEAAAPTLCTIALPQVGAAVTLCFIAPPCAPLRPPLRRYHHLYRPMTL